MNENYATQILKVFAASPFTPFNHKQVSAKLGAYDKGTRQLVQATILELAENKILIEEGRGKYKINPRHINDDLLPKNYIIGTVDMKPTGKAYVIPQDQDREDILISPNNIQHALHGDTVKVMLFPPRKMKKPEGQVVEIIARAKNRFVGTLKLHGKFAFMIPDNSHMVVDIFISPDDINNAQEGDKVLVEMTEWPSHMNNPVGKVVKVLGKPGINNVEMQSILAEYDFPLDFPKNVEEEAEKISFPSKKDLKNRKDFRDVCTFTIDPEDAKDFDDALSFKNLDNGNCEVGVHIADVSYYVTPGSAIDHEAYSRATSVYLVDRTVPMLPEKLCNGVCSLRPNEEKLCFSVVMEITPEAQVVSSWFGRTIINSNRRLCYEEAQSIIENPEEHTGENCAYEILELHKLATIMREYRYKNGAINFESQEVKFRLDENAKPIGVYIKEQKEANWLIEEFMLLANKKVAEWVGDRKNRPLNENGKYPDAKTFVYRVHDEPNPEKLNTFVEFVSKLGFKMKLGSRKALAQSYNKLFHDIAGRGEEYMIDSIAIRTMSKAYYSTENIGHYGLAFRFYTHFTSPIRRYPDLMVHRLLASYLDNGPSADQATYEEYCKHCSLMEKKAADAERASVKYKQAEFLSDKVGMEFPALISGVSKWGIYAEIEGNKCEGLIPMGSLKDDYYYLDEDNYQVIGRRNGRQYKLGSSIRIKVKGVDMLKKQINFEMVENVDEILDINPPSKKQVRRATSKKSSKGSSKAHGKDTSKTRKTSSKARKSKKQ